MKHSNQHKWKMGGIAFLTLFAFSSAMADVLVITPPEAQVPLKGHVKFEAQLFNNMAMPLKLDQRVTWKVVPEDLGKITDDGFFMAGDKPGRGLVVATLKVLNQEFRAEAKVQVGPNPSLVAHLPELIVSPKEAAIGLGDSLQFKAILHFPRTNGIIANILIRWTVKPNTLGKITQHGKFYAGNTPGVGAVIAYAEYMGHRLSGEAYVVVGKTANAAITGLVMDEDNQTPLTNALLIAERIGRIKWFRRTHSDTNGVYQLNHLIPGWYVVQAMKDGFIREFYQDVRYFDQATPVQVSDGDTVGNIDFHLNHGGAIAGTVYSEFDSSALEDAHVIAYLKVAPKKKYHTLTNLDGTYSISGLHTGSYVVAVNKEGFRGEFYDDVQREADATLVQVTEPDTAKNIDFALAMRSAIAGRVISDADGSPIAGAIVRARNLNYPDWMKAAKTRTNENGEYVLQVPPAYYLVRVEADSFNGEFYDDTYDPALATPVEVVADQHTTGIDFSLAPLSVISGTVTDQATGDALADAVVWAYPEVGPPNPVRTQTDANGYYELTHVHPGIYFIKATAKGYYPEFYEEAGRLADATPVAVGYNQQISDINFTLTRASSISGVVVDETDNSPIARALVIAKKQNSHFEARAFTNEDGEYLLEGLPAGTYIVLAMAKDYYREFYDNAAKFEDATPIDVGESEEITGIDFSLMPAPEDKGKITGHVIADADGLPIPGAMVVGLSFRGGKAFFAITNSEGRYALKGLPTGEYYVFAWASGYIGEFYDDVHNWKKATLVKVVSPNTTPHIDFGLAKKQIGPYVIRGKIVARTTRLPIANVLVFAYRGKIIAGFGITDPQGNYSIPEMPAGRFKIVASVPGMIQNLDGDPKTSDSLAVDLSSGQDAPQANITMDIDVSTDVSENGEGIPQSYALDQNYPNPFNPETEIHFAMPQSGEVTLRIYNLLGQQIATLVQGTRLAGTYSVKWDGKNNFHQMVPSGIYFYRIQVKNQHGIVFDQVKKMTLMR